jgi:hypothetical protein
MIPALVSMALGDEDDELRNKASELLYINSTSGMCELPHSCSHLMVCKTSGLL